MSGALIWGRKPTVGQTSCRHCGASLLWPAECETWLPTEPDGELHECPDLLANESGWERLLTEVGMEEVA